MRLGGSIHGNGGGEFMNEDIDAELGIDGWVDDPGFKAVVRGMPGVPHGSGSLTSARSFCVRASV